MHAGLLLILSGNTYLSNGKEIRVVNRIAGSEGVVIIYDNHSNAIQEIMKRRSFLTQIGVGTLGTGIGLSACQQTSVNKIPEHTGIFRAFSTSGHQVSFYVEGLKEPVKILHVTDTHLFLDDKRGEAFTPYSGRMAKAYNQTKHWRTGEDTNPEKAFEETVAFAKESNVDLLALSGDIFSFPSEAAVEWVLEKLEKSGLDYLYTTGNHDWHYEGMEGSSHDLRAEWSGKRLRSLFQGNDLLMAAKEIKGITFLSIDNSTYEITEAQLSFLRKHIQSGKPLVLLVHIPFFAPGRSIGYGCGHPDWGWDSDNGFEIERRERWPKSGHTEVTLSFRREVFAAPNMLGIFAGHVHRQTIDQINGIPQFLTAPNATGAFRELDFHPISERDLVFLTKG